MRVLVLNSGSSSIKFQLIAMPEANVLAQGLVERIGLDLSKLKFKAGSRTMEVEKPVDDHQEGLKAIASFLLTGDAENEAILTSPDDLELVGHRVVHGGSDFSKTVVIDQKVKDNIRSLFGLAPLHNPANYKGIEVAEKIFPKATQVAVFDTAFHQTIPEKAYRYALPESIYQKENLRLFGFHGTSHKYVTEQARAFLEGLTPVRAQEKIISIHLGNGCSMTAVRNGQSIDHSLGFGPMNGLIMGTRSGDIDQSVIFHLMDQLGMSAEEVQKMLQKESGMLGLTGFSDLREIESSANEGDQTCKLALEMNAYRIKKYIGAYTAAMNGLDALVFTAGIGENSKLVRSLVCEDMDHFGVELDAAKNQAYDEGIAAIQKEGAKVQILVVPTNEEIEIARQSYALMA